MDIEKIKKKYRINSILYDFLWSANNLRRQAIEKLDLKPGDTVLDFGCGTGLNFQFLEEKIGPKGKIIALELSEGMIKRAKEKAVENHWNNIMFVNDNAENIKLDTALDAILCYWVNDIMNSPIALKKAVSYLKDSGVVVSAGAKRPKSIIKYILLYPLFHLIRYLFTDSEIKIMPWERMYELLTNLDVEDELFGFAYYAKGIKRR